MIPGKPQTIAPGVRRIVAGNAGLMTGPGTNTYLLGNSEITVLDPGPDDAHHLQCILAAAGPSIRWIVVTHTHPDHSPLAAALARATGARLTGLPPPADGRQDETFQPDEVPRDGQTLLLGDIVLRAIHTPGHASNCLCYLLLEQHLLFTGDHVLEGVSPVILAPDGDMGSYIDSLDKLNDQPFDRIAPGHGEVMENGKAVIASLRAHRMAREAKVLRRLSPHQGASIDELTATVYDDVPLERHVWARLTLEAHLIKLRREGKAAEHAGLWRTLEA